jgi:hypothetical protein
VDLRQGWAADSRDGEVDLEVADAGRRLLSSAATQRVALRQAALELVAQGPSTRARRAWSTRHVNQRGTSTAMPQGVYGRPHL